ncbi:MAG TPA: ornithine cyclodeaminase family protein [Acidobacteriaceae bacterium]|jgi:thiomorpholine-carboxylate dehydrogenase|nr:ornithine cyclodeaminase family protein [Acidobacteriaceae bacterium]
MEYLNEDQVRPLLTYEELIPAVERALIGLSAGTVRQPVRGILPVPEHRGFFAWMPAVDGDLMGAKLVTFYPENRGEPTHQAVIQLFSAKTGEPLVAMDGRLITEMRTAAVTAAAVRCLARPNAQVLAILGSGVQARSHIHALRLVRDFAELRVWSRTPANAQRFADEFGLKVWPTAEAAVRGADVVVSVACGEEPMVRGAWLTEGALVCAIASVGPTKRELDDAAMQAEIVVESREAALRESGDVIGAGRPIAAELGELLSGHHSLSGAGQWIVFKSLGVGAVDLAAARLVWERAIQGSLTRK